jgi:transcriptional regulator with PAS, ATPase and Fis domain
MGGDLGLLELINIQEYVQKMAIIISTVLDMEVLIGDTHFKILGDSQLQLKSKTYFGKNSITAKALKEKKIIIIEDRKMETVTCNKCSKNNNCDICSMIVVPIMKNEILIGSVAIYASTNEDREKLIRKRKIFIDFITKMSDLLLSKLEENHEELEIKIFYKRLSFLIEYIDFALIGLDEKYNIINYNSKFRKMFGLGYSKIKDLNEVFDYIDDEDFYTLINKNTYGEKQITFRINGKRIRIVVTCDPITVDGINRGSLICFRKTEELYKQINKVSSNVSDFKFDQIVGCSDRITKLKNDAQIFAKSSSTVLIQGESGTGKELFARAIHSESNVSKGPFIAVNCAAIPDDLLESEFFGYEDGAFTGCAKGGKIGKFELANGGSLLLDEVGEMPIHLQSKLLRAIQERKIQRIGSNMDIPVKIRIIATTNRNLGKMVKTGEFREDLYYRLNVIPLFIPPLRDRKEDITVFLGYFLDIYNKALNKNIKGFQDNVKELMYNYSWPGNIRELQNTVEYAVNIVKGDFISIEDLPPMKCGYVHESAKEEYGLIRPLKEVEEMYIDHALNKYGDTLKGKENAAKALGISRATLYRRIQEKKINQVQK